MRAGVRESLNREPSTVVVPSSSCSSSTKWPRCSSCGSRKHSALFCTTCAGTSRACNVASISPSSSVAVHAAIASSSASRFASRPSIVAKRSSEARSALPITSTIAVQSGSSRAAIATQRSSPAAG